MTATQDFVARLLSSFVVQLQVLYLRMLIAALLVLYASSTVAIGFSPPIVLENAALMEPHTEEELTMTLVFFFLSIGRKYLVIRKGPTTFVLKVCRYSSAVL